METDMRTATKNKNKFVLTLMFTIIIILTLVVVVLVAALMKRPAEEIDPHEGQVYINDGFGMVWMTPLEGVDVNNISQSDIVRYDGVPKYVGEGYETLRGVDVSEHQYDIDWAAVAASGVDFAYIRLGYRGYTRAACSRMLISRPTSRAQRAMASRSASISSRRR